MSHEIIKLSQYTQPTIVEKNSEDWVSYNYRDAKTGRVYSYFQFLIDRYRNSTTNNAAINNITKLIYGGGLKAKSPDKNPLGVVALKKLFSKTTLRNVIFDYKALGSGAFQVIWSKDGKTIAEVQHISIQNILPNKCNEEGIVEGYWYCDNWAKSREFKPRYIPLLTGVKVANIELVVFGDYSPGSKYFYAPDYEGCLDYCLLEEKISEFLVNHTENSFSGTTILNFNTGAITDPILAQQAAQKVKDNFTGSNGAPLIVAFNDNKDQNVSVDNIEISDAADKFTYLSGESESKILAGHNVISSMLIGISKDGQGFSNNGEEIEKASLYMVNTVIKSKQETLIDNINKILSVNGIFLDLYFERKKAFEEEISSDVSVSATRIVDGINSLSPLVANKVLESMTPDEIRQLVGLNPTPQANTTLSKEGDIEGYELVDSRQVVYEHETDLDNQIKTLNEPTTLQKIINLVKSGVAYPKRKSEQDSDLFLVRYRYSGNAGENSRDFCKKMLNDNKLYRKEDIELMSESEVNKGWGPEGANNYDIFLYKGGGDCHHFWTRETYRKKGTDLSSPNKQQVTPAQARKEGEILPTNPMKVYQKPVDMPYNGFLPTNPRFN
jgi:hypothetical protein